MPQPQLSPDEKITRDLAQVNDWFSYHAPDEHQQDLLIATRERFRGLAGYLVANVNDSRERAIALTELRKVAMLFGQAIIFDKP